MVDVRQLELELGDALGDAADRPETANILELWQRFEAAMTALPPHEQLRIGGDVLSQLAEICEAKSEMLWDDWQDANNSDGPVMDENWLQGFTRRTQDISFANWVQRSERKSAQTLTKETEENDCDPVVREVDKQSVLKLIDQLTLEEAQADILAVSHAENISAWVQALSTLQGQTPQKLVDLQFQVQMPLVEVWMAALLGQFSLDQRGDFYETQTVWISGL